MRSDGSPYRAAFDDGVTWDIVGMAWTVSGWIFSVGELPFDVEIEVGGARHAVPVGLPRPDVAAAYGNPPGAEACGFAAALRIPTGTHSVRLVARDSAATEVLLERALSVAIAPIAFNVDTPGRRVPQPGRHRVAGWCAHPDEEIYSLFVTVAGQTVQARYGLGRADVAAAVPGAPEACGFEAFVNLPVGTFELTLEARLCSGARVTAVSREPLQVQNPSLYRRVTMAAGTIATIARRGHTWHRTRRRWPKLREWPHLVRRARQEIARSLRSGGATTPFHAPVPIDRYEAWLAVNAWTSSAEHRLRARLAEFAGRLPRVSVVMPVYNPRMELLTAAVASVRTQLYPGWDLCIADDCSSDPKVRDYLRTLAADGRVRVQYRTTNGNISAATNDAAALATGDVLVFLDQDDLLAPDCLAEIALAIARHPDADIVYSDDDKIERDGRRHSPQFKPDWSPELLLSCMYMSHAFAVRRSLFNALGGMRAGFDGSQDHDFALRASEQARRVVHVPRVLYHWRVAPGSTAESQDAKPQSTDAGRRAVQEALQRRGLVASVTHPEWAARARVNTYEHEFEDDGPSVVIIVPATADAPTLRRCLESLQRTTYRHYRVLVADNGSNDTALLQYLGECGHDLLPVDAGLARVNLGALWNQAAQHTGSEFLLFLDGSAEIIEPRWLSCMMGYARLPNMGAVGARVVDARGDVVHAGIVHGYDDGLAGAAFTTLADDDPGYLAYSRVTRNCSAVAAACLLTPRATFLAHGGFDEGRFGTRYYDVDYCYRLLHAGLRCTYAAGARIVQHAASPSARGEPAEVAEFRRAYRTLRDPYYSRHLSLQTTRFEVQPVHVETGTRPRGIRALMCCFNLNWEGAPYSQFEMTRELARRRVLDPVVFSPSDGPLRAAYEEAGIEVQVRAHPLANCTSEAEYEAAMKSFVAWVGSLGVCVVYGNTLQTFYAIDAAHRLGLPSLWNPRESEPWREYFRGFGPDVESAALSCFKYPYRVIFVAHATARGYRELDSHHNFCVIHNGLDPAVITEAKSTLTRPAARAGLGLEPDEVAILLLGTVCERKGQLDAIEAWGRLPEAIVAGARLYVVGDRPGAYSSALHGRLAQLPAQRRERVHIVAETDRVAPYFRAADAFLCTSVIESYPRVVLEAMAWDLPIVTTPVFGISEQVIPEVNALLYEPGEAAVLAQQLERIIADSDLRRSMAARASEVLATLNDFSEMTDEYARVFEEASLVAESHPQRPKHGRAKLRAGIRDLAQPHPS